MLNKWIDVAVNNRLLIVLGLLVAIILSIFILPRLNLDAFPDVTNVQVAVNTEAPGLASEEVEQLITYPIEAAMFSLPDVEEVRSISKVGLSVITVVFKEGVNIYFARQQVFERLQSAREEIPPGVGSPEIGPNTSGLGQIFQYILKTDNPEQYNTMTLRGLNDWVVKLLLAPVDGVTDVLSFGGQVRQYQVQIDPARLLAYGLTVDDLVNAIETNNRNAGGWYLNQGAEQLVIRGVGWVRSGDQGLQDIANIAVKDKDGTVIRVRDLAQVAYGSEIRQGAVLMTQRDAKGVPQPLGEVVTGIILKRMGANTKATIDGIKSRLPLVQKALPPGVKLVPFYDQANLIQQAVHTVVKALIEAFILVFIVLFLFLLNLRTTFLVLLSVPISVGFALVVMAYWGISANLMSLGGLAIAIGMMIDGSVVMMENIFKHLTQPGLEHALLEKKEAEILSQQEGEQGKVTIALRIQEAAREVARPVFFAVLIIMVVFAPLFTLQGVEGKLFQPMAISIILAMLASLLVALLVIPALATYLFRKNLKHRKNPLLQPLFSNYEKVLTKVLKYPKIVMSSAVILLLLSLLLLPFLGTEFVPELEEGTLNIRVTLAPSASLDTALTVAQKLEQQVMTFPEASYATSRIGRPELGGDPEPVSNIEIMVGLHPISTWKSAKNRQQLQDLMEKKMAVYPGLLFSFSQPIASRVDELLSGVRAQLAIKLFGPDLAVLADKGRGIETLVKSVKGTRDVAMEQITGEAQLVIKPNREALMRYGISVGQVMALISDAIGGKTAGQVINGNERYDIYVRLAQPYRDSIETISNLILQSPKGAWVRLGNVATVQIESGAPQIRRDNVQRRVVIQANVEGRDMGSVVTEIQQKIEQMKLPAGYTVIYGGQFENQQRAQARLMIVVPISLALIFLLLYFAFNSAGQALLVMSNVPLALIGGILALFISGQYLSVPGSIGFIALFGIAVLNGVVLVNAINQNKQGGMATHDAVFIGALSRLRPVLMTAFITALGLIPMLLARGIGAEVQRPLATVVVGGLISSTALTLFVLPVLYEFFFKKAVE